MPKTPDEIKNGLVSCISVGKCWTECPYFTGEALPFTCIRALSADALAIIQQLEAKVPRWISTEERLPEPLTDVVVIVRHGDGWQYTIGYVLNEEWHRTGGSRHFYYGGKITHWIPLPEPPKEE